MGTYWRSLAPIYIVNHGDVKEDLFCPFQADVYGVTVVSFFPQTTLIILYL